MEIISPATEAIMVDDWFEFDKIEAKVS